MAKGRDIAAESLADVLELLRRRRQSGLLSVERYVEGRMEEGELYFREGQITYARAGQLAGQEALSAMSRWRQVFFTFLPNEPQPQRNISTPAAPPRSMAVAARPVEQVPGFPPVNEPGLRPVPSPAMPQVRTNAAPLERNNVNTAPLQEPAGVDTITPGFEWIIPRRLAREQDVLSMPLTRPQRSLYMLIDGRRSVSDLARCTRKSMQEIERLLSELQQRGLIAL